jgi:uncharacterized membrane protein YbaN (DUF454 family)
MTADAKPLNELKKGKPGEQFQRLHEQRQDSPHGGAKNAAFIAIGVLIVALGMLTYPIPVIPSDVIVLLGVALFAQGSMAGARTLDWLEVQFRRRFPGVIPWWERLPRGAKLFITVAWPTTVGTIFYLIYRIAGE